MADDDYFDWSDDEDDIICTSKYISSDEEDFSFPIKPTSKRSNASNKATDDQNDFEREMASELSMTVQHLAASFAKKKPQNSSTNTLAIEAKDKDKKKTEEGDAKFYDDVYFDSDDSEEEATESSSRRVMSNDELLYDPTLDDKDQAWVDNKRRSYQPIQKRGMKRGGKSSSRSSLPQSDAVLNCPACLTTLCMDCQRHEIYHNQYRAMFVFNCSIDKSESLRFPSKIQKKKEYFRNKKKKKLQQGETDSEQDSRQDQFMNLVPVSDDNAGTEISQPESPNEGTGTTRDTASPAITAPEASSSTGCEGDELYHSVNCKICNTKVAVYDKDEVYHFFNVVTSY